ncbi:MAG: zinc ribbon domain-containing protein [Bacillota bacterium]|nr:zinc ribbon domain-containing protein [Bacillota bacterium]
MLGAGGRGFTVQVDGRGVSRVPIYEFKCCACGRRFEELCPVGEDGSSLVCPDCGSERLKRCASTFSARSTGAGGSGALGGSGCAPT